MNKITMKYPYGSDYDAWDGKEHDITPKPEGLYEFSIGDNTYYYMEYFDNTYNNNMQTILSVDEYGNIVKTPLDNYNRLQELMMRLIKTGNIKPTNIDILPEKIELGNTLVIDELINPKEKKPLVDTQALYIAHVVDSNHSYIPVSIYNQYLTGRYEVKPTERTINGVECILVTQDDIDYVSRVSHRPNLKPDYKPLKLKDPYDLNYNNRNEKPLYVTAIDGLNPPINNNENEFPRINQEIINGIVMDYPDMRDYPNLENNRLWDGRTHSISPESLQMFYLNGRRFYFMNYIDNDYNSECIALLGEDEQGNIVKIPLDNYDKLPELLSRVELEDVNISRLPNHIHLGELLEIDYLISLNNNLEVNNNGEYYKPYQPFAEAYNNVPPKPPIVNNNNKPSDDSISIKKEKFDGKQALFTVFRDVDGTLRVDAVEYDFYLNDLLDKETHPVIKGKVVLTSDDLEFIYNNSKNPELMPDFELEYLSFKGQLSDYDRFDVYITEEGLEIDSIYYHKFLELGLLNERELINGRVKISKEEIHNIEKYEDDWKYYAKFVNELPLKSEVAFTVYNVNGKHFEVTNNIYERYLKQYVNPNNDKERHAGWNDMGDHFDVLTEEDLKTIERDSKNPKLTPTILYKERKLRDIYGNNIDDNTNTIDNSKSDDNQPNIENPPVKKRSKVKQIIKNTKDWAKKHPILATIGIGLSVLLASQVALSGVMMLNSTLWSILGGTGSACTKLHAVNMALSKIVGLGAFKFTEAGTYALAGKAGALSLYSGVGAKLTTAVLGLTGIGGLGKLIANKIQKRKNKKEENSKTEKESINLTKEQIAELIKQEVEKATRDKDATIERLINENQELRTQLEENLGRTK